MQGDDLFDEQLLALQKEYLTLINQTLPGRFTRPVRFNHCFARIILDWTFAGNWRTHLRQSTPAYKQLTAVQLQAAVQRMRQWLLQPQLLSADNNASLCYRSKIPG